MTPDPGAMVRLSWSARESFSADVPERRLTALGELDPIRRPDGSVDLDALGGDVDESTLDGLLADLETLRHSNGVQEREIDEAYRLPEASADVAVALAGPDVPGCSCGMADLGAPGHDQTGPAGEQAGLHVQDITADVRCDDQGQPFADTVITLDTGERITVTVHLSLAYGDTVNIEIDGDFTADRPSLRINLNDNLVHDSTRNDPAVDSPRRPDLPDPSSTDRTAVPS